MKKRRFLHVDFDCFFVSVERLYNSELVGKPVVVGHEIGARGVVASASYEARKFGIHSAMPMHQAFALCPNLIRITPHHKLYEEHSRRIMRYLAQYTPHIEIASIDEAYLDLTGTERLYGSLEDLAHHLKDEIMRIFGVPVSIGGAGNRSTAKIATSKAKPNGVFIVKPGTEREFLDPLPVEEMPGIGKRTAAILRSLGIDTLGKLAQAPEPLLRQYIGRLGIYFKMCAQGHDPEHYTSDEHRKSIGHSETFEQPVSDVRVLEEWLISTVRELGFNMRLEGLCCTRVGVVLRKPDMTDIKVERSIAQYAFTDVELLSAAVPLLHTAFERTEGRVRLIGVRLERLKPYNPLPTFLPSSKDKLERLQQVVDSLAKKFGTDKVKLGESVKQ